MSDVLRRSPRTIDLADGAPSKGNFIMGPRWRPPSRCGLLPGLAWVVPDGATTCGTAWP